MNGELLVNKIPSNSIDFARGEIMRENTLSRDDVLAILRKRKADFASSYGVTAIGIFGSFARGQAKKDSDIDLVVKMKKPDLFYMVHIKEELEGECRTRVDIVHYREKMNAFLKKRIDQEAVYV
jgi:hypothetical protein